MSEAENRIELAGLKVRCRIGVPEEERAQEQELLLDVNFSLGADFAMMGDDLAKTVDYDALVREIEALCKSRERLLIETLAADVAGLILGKPGVQEARVRVRKFILPQCEHVAAEYRKRLGKQEPPRSQRLKA